MDDFGITQSKIGESAQRVADQAIEEARRRGHFILTNEHIFFAFVQVEWDVFTLIMRGLELSPHIVIQALEEHLHGLPKSTGHEFQVSLETKLVFKLAFRQANLAGRQTIGAPELVAVIFEDIKGVSATIMRRFDIAPEVIVDQVVARMRDKEMREVEVCAFAQNRQ